MQEEGGVRKSKNDGRVKQTFGEELRKLRLSRQPFAWYFPSLQSWRYFWKPDSGGDNAGDLLSRCLEARIICLRFLLDRKGTCKDTDWLVGADDWYVSADNNSDSWNWSAVLAFENFNWWTEKVLVLMDVDCSSRRRKNSEIMRETASAFFGKESAKGDRLFDGISETKKAKEKKISRKNRFKIRPGMKKQELKIETEIKNKLYLSVFNYVRSYGNS